MCAGVFRNDLRWARVLFRTGSACIVFCVLGVTALAQETTSGTASIRGQVVDQQGGVIQDATVILFSSAAVRVKEAKTDETGAFSFSDVRPGDYVVEVERSGFAQVEKNVTIASAQRPVQVSIQMKVAGPGQQVTVTAEAGSFRTDESSVATKTNIPLNEIPQGVGVANQALIKSQQAIRFADAAQNISGVNRDVLAAGSIGNALTIRGLPLGIFSNYYRDGFVFDGMVPSDTTDVEQVEILKGPSSVLYGRATAGGIVDLITKEPLPKTYADFSFQGDRYGSVRPTFDITGPIGSSGKLLYRVNGEFADYSNFRDYFHDRRYFLAPAVTWKPDESTTLRFLVEYLHGRTTTDYGIPALGDRPAPVPISNYYGEPWQYSLLQNRRGSVDVSHSLGRNWAVRSRFQATLTNWDYLDTSTGYLESDNRTLTRYSEDTAYPLRFYDWQTDLTGLFRTGKIEHNFLIGFEYGTQSVVQDGVFSDAPPIDLYDPVPFSKTLPDPTTLETYFFNPADPDYFPINGTTRLATHGGYIQDQIAITSKLKILAGVRFEGFTQKYDELVYGTHNRQSNFSALPRVGATYQLTQSVSLYASYSRGFSPTLAAQFGPNGLPFKPESSHQYEFGVRTSELHGRLSSSLAFYRIRASNLLVTNPGNPLASIQIGEAGSKGIEADTTGRILPGWDLNFAYAYNEARIASDPVYPAGNIFQNAPRNSGSIWSIYEVQHGPLTGLSFGGGVQALSYRYVDPSDDVLLPGYARVDAGASYVFGPSRHDVKIFKISANIQNLTNRRYFESGSTPTVIFPGSPIDVWSQLEVRF
ncbi:MAG TPA: TonB-dependent receptor [Candidatus Sulfotelmatobacter sp.]|nr:TonB-dependent receptor [Candidatus Sulfotelmatobacter sp.]